MCIIKVDCEENYDVLVILSAFSRKSVSTGTTTSKKRL